ncbi:immunoglobulin kappa light chain-like isoform X3 [Pelodiscus sinensis]|uniref:immunoglobulin kappa light chain-like isoform X3 n=1 Tax=Pelodiscus sinensis TaxID=13735 RepID=UPI003F6AB712
MSHQVVGMILVYLHTPSEEGIQIQQSPGQMWLTPGQKAQLDCSHSLQGQRALWYKEQPSGSLQRIEMSDGRYSSTVNISANRFSLMISNVQRDDSGVYFCGLNAYIHPDFGNGTRLIVTDASEPRLSVLVPSDLGDAELFHDVPLLCLLSDFAPPWSILWDTGEGDLAGQMDAGAIDGDGVFSVWSLTTILSKWWNQGMNCTCTAKENGTGRNISTTVTKETADCRIVFYAGLPCIFILLLIQLLILLWRKRLTRGRAVPRENPIPMRQVPQTEYATLTHNRNAPF